MWWIWLVIALIAAVVELTASGLVFAGVGVAALLTAAVAALGGPLLLDAVVFLAASGSYVLLLRPTMLRLISGQRSGTGSPKLGSQLQGKRAIVTQAVSRDSGQIRLGQGEFWSARSYELDDVLPVGSQAEIVMVEGLTALVEPVNARITATSEPSVADPAEDKQPA